MSSCAGKVTKSNEQIGSMDGVECYNKKMERSNNGADVIWDSTNSRRRFL